ncbi:MAG: DUF4142 domain-containing protein [Reyranella sp.]
MKAWDWATGGGGGGGAGAGCEAQAPSTNAVASITDNFLSMIHPSLDDGIGGRSAIPSVEFLAGSANAPFDQDQRAPMPSGPNNAQQATLNRLAGMSVPDFDREYMPSQIEVSDYLANTFRSYGANGESPTLRVYARRPRPTTRTNRDAPAPSQVRFHRHRREEEIMLHIIRAALVVAALIAETTVIRHWSQQHALVEQAAAAPAFQSIHQIRN